MTSRYRPRRSLLLAACTSMGLGACAVQQAPGQPAGPAGQGVSHADLAVATPDAGASSDAAVDLAPAAPTPDLALQVAIVQNPIPFPDSRKQEMATYSLHHYGDETYALSPKQIVLHYTESSTASSAWNTFAEDTPNRDELPGTCAHYLVDKDGTIYQLVDDAVRCRHAIGVNQVALGIEMVQEAGSSASWSDQQILDRPAQLGAVLQLVQVLQARYGIAKTDVIGHASTNDSRFFVDLEGWLDDHDDWQPDDVDTIRSLLP